MRNFLTLSLVLITTTTWAENYTGRVIGVADGDTVTVLDEQNRQHKVRLAGIDAPEKAQAYGQASKQHLASLVFDKQVTIEFEKLDRYQREVGKVVIAGRDANLEQVKAGLAWHYKKYEREQSIADRQAYAVAEERAVTARHGLWADLSPVAPWDYRKLRREK